MKQTNLKTSLVLIASSLLVVTGCANSTENTSPTSPAVITSSDASIESASPTETVTVTPSDSASPSASASASSDASDDEIILSTATTSLGEIIVGKDGMTVYYFTNDVKGSDTSNCKGQCIVNWPPVISESGNPKVEGITAEVDTIKTADGQKHVTVNGMPVYYWIKDKAPGDVTGQGVQNVWYVISPDGTMIESPAPTGGSTS